MHAWVRLLSIAYNTSGYCAIQLIIRDLVKLQKMVWCGIIKAARENAVFVRTVTICHSAGLLKIWQVLELPVVL